MYGVPLPPSRERVPPALSSSRFEELSPSTSDRTSSSSSTTRIASKSTPGSYTPSGRGGPGRTTQLKDAALHLIWHPTALLFDRRYYWLVAGGLLVLETLMCGVIIKRVRYTEIDFSTYLEQAQHFLNGERDYSQIRGESGPCVYPSLHLYLYSLLFHLVQPVFGEVKGVPMRIVGGHLERAQWAFAGVYVLSLACVFVVYGRNRKLPQYLHPLLCISKRLHSIYVLRMFNDGLAMLFFYAGLVCYTADIDGKGTTAGRRRLNWAIGTGLFALALNTKMSILLFLPGLVYLLFVYHSPLTCLLHSLFLALSQLLLALPLIRPPPHLSFSSLFSSSPSIRDETLGPLRTYLSQAYNFNRSFLFEFTVNWRFLGASTVARGADLSAEEAGITAAAAAAKGEEIFLSEGFKHLLLGMQVVGLVLFAVRWAEEEGGVFELLERGFKRPLKRPARRSLTAERTTTILFTSNFLGILFARSLHHQFYAWFAWQGVWMVFGAAKGVWEGMQGLLLLSLLEYAFHTYPSTTNSSLGFCIAMLVILAGVYYGRPAGEGRGEQPFEVEGGERKGKRE
ncbi:hypothetical protein JCM8547_006082 [Rhodosporidiobolus lusitaniae]